MIRNTPPGCDFLIECKKFMRILYKIITRVDGLLCLTTKINYPSTGQECDWDSKTTNTTKSRGRITEMRKKTPNQ